MGVHDVESGTAAALGAQPPRCPNVGAIPARIEREQLKVDLARAPQRVDLVGDEPAPGGPLGARVHVGDDQGAHATAHHCATAPAPRPLAP